MRKYEILGTVLAVALTCTVCASATPSAESAKPAEPRVWDKLNLSRTTIAGATVYYEKAFETKLPVFEKEYTEFLAERDKSKAIISKKDRIITDINHILGIDEPDTRMQNKIWTDLAGVVAIEKTVFCVVRQDTIKDFLRAGGHLPNFTYSKAGDVATYKPEFNATTEQGPIKDFEFTFPIASDETFRKNVSLTFQILRYAFDNAVFFATIHEVAEASLLMRARPTDPYWRWFSDGFANAITYELLKKHADEKMAEEFAAGQDVNNCKDLSQEMNLQYWMSLKYCVLQGTPVEYENKLTQARYAYATLEARRLVQAHGINCVRKILDEVCTKESRRGQDLLKAIEKVTGENMRQRLSTYQSFETRKEGIAKYTLLFNAASEEKDYTQMFVNLLRIMELRPMTFSPRNLRDFKQAARLLFKLGHEQAGDKVMHKCMWLFEGSPIPDGRQAAMEMFIMYALECKNAGKASEVAEELLKTKPDHVLSLTVKMLLHAEAARLGDARHIAQKIHSLTENKQSPSYKAASRILATDPNQSGAQK